MGALLPFILVFTLTFFSLPLPISTPALLKTYLTLSEAEALAPSDPSSDVEPIKPSTPPKPLWRGILFVTVGQLEALTHLAQASYLLITSAPLNEPFISILLALSWLYTILRPVVRPTRTVPYDLFAVYSALFIGALLQLGGVFYDHGVFGDEWPSVGVFVALWANLVVTTGVLGVVLGMPLALPGRTVKEEEIGLSVSPEDYTSLFGWITFSWVYPLVHRGRYTTLNEKDVWALSPTLQSRSIFIKFVTLPQTTLLRKLFTANSLDLFLDFSLTLVSVCFNYAGPFFLKRILDAIDLTSPTSESRAQAYIYAVLAFVCSLCKSQADVQHLWFGRRAATRIRSELMASIYDKALKRKDFSGIVDREKKKAETETADKHGKSKSKSKSKKDEEKSDEAKAGADVGKIVNLMAGDANRVSMTVSASYFIYGAPFEIILASLFLYNLLGLAAFAGFFVLLLGWPLNSYIARRSIRIQKGLLGARDRRMGVLSEMMGAVKFIKFFAWEGKWVERVMEMRAEEMRWMVKARVNSVAFSLLWTSAPILISIISFFAYVMQGNELTISTAFTAIALFNMVRAPLNVIPTWIVQILQTGVALNRIAVYLDEDEVSEQVSSLKKDAAQPTTEAPSANNADEEGLGIENGSFKWNEVEVPKADPEGADKGKDKDGKTSPSVDETATIVEGETQVLLGEGMSDTAAPEVDMDHRFELRDINVLFPEGELSVITGPTASGKTALLMALLGEMSLIPSTPPGKLIMSKSPSKLDSHSHGHSYSLSYAAQAPWLRHQSIRDNILFGAPFDSARYDAVLDACALRTDLDVLEDGDLTEIGARGVSLSGGQKARVALARAVYSRARYVLLDDPLSAVDSGTAGWIVDNLLKGGLLEGRTVILVTHHVDLVLPAAHYLVRMLDGRIDTQGTIKDLRAQGVLEELTHDSAVTIAEAEVQQEALAPTPSDSENADGDEEEVKKAKAGKKPRKLVKDEHREVGGVKWAIYKSYLKAS
ncbi:hypothetical protein DXG01_001538, partial [Tephrocybe rancida]